MSSAVERRTLLGGLGAGLALMAGAPLIAGDRTGDPPFQGRSPAVGRRGMVATAQPLASEAAALILRQGGSAADAAIAANAVLGLVEPTGCGIGGDLFALVWNPGTRAVEALSSYGPAPAALDVAAFRRRHAGRGTIDPLGFDAITIPGAVAGWAALHERLGRLPLAEVLTPAITLARDGFAVSPVIARGWANNLRAFEAGRARIEAADLAFGLYAPGGRAPAAGEAFANPDLAATYALIAEAGADAFYRGAFADDFERHARAHGKPHRASDLAGFAAEWVAPISAAYRGHRLWQVPPATQGLTTLQMARMLDLFPVATLSEADRLHLLVEIKKLAFADRARFIADPATAPVPVEALLADAYIAARARLIDMARALPDDVTAGDPEGEQSDTTYLATADGEGLMVSLIQSNYRGMGSGVVIPRGGRGPRRTWGFMLQNRGAQFALDPGHANAIAPGKRPFHTIIPGMVTKDEGPFLAFGVMGGTMQPQGQVQVLSNLVDHGMNLQAAGDAPRVRHLGSPDPGDGRETPPGVAIESGFSDATRAELARRGHRILDTPQAMGGYQAVMWDTERHCWWGATEKRNDGLALGV